MRSNRLRPPPGWRWSWIHRGGAESRRLRSPLPRAGRRYVHELHKTGAGIEVNHCRSTLAFPGRDVGESSVAVYPGTAVRVDVTKHVQCWLDATDSFKQVLATGALGLRSPVAVSLGRTMRHKHVDVVGDEVPALAE